MKRLLLAIILILYGDPGFALTIATGPSDGTYIQIARDIQKVAEKDGIKVDGSGDARVLREHGPVGR